MREQHQERRPWMVPPPYIDITHCVDLRRIPTLTPERSHKLGPRLLLSRRCWNRTDTLCQSRNRLDASSSILSNTLQLCWGQYHKKNSFIREPSTSKNTVSAW